MVQKAKQLRFGLLIFLLFIHFSGKAGSFLTAKDLNYGDGNPAQTLDVYYPETSDTLNPVFVFIHGGSWDSGSKDQYGYLGRNLAKNGVVAVIVNYTLSPAAQIQDMSAEISRALHWVKDHAAAYAGDPTKITVGGHSAGGHLAAVAGTSEDSTLISKVVLIDAFGLDMVSYFQQYHNKYSQGLYATFTEDPAYWRKWSPLYQIAAGSAVKWMILTGGSTFPAIKSCNRSFVSTLEKNQLPITTYEFPDKKHVAMIAQFLSAQNPAWDVLLPFIKSVN